MTRAWSRRSLLGGMGLGALAAACGCGVRLEEDAPRVPLVPTREPVPDEEMLLRTLEHTRSLQALAAEVADAGEPTRVSGLPAELAELHRVQVDVLADLLVAGGVPLPTTTSAPSGTPSEESLSSAELSAAADPALDALAEVSAPNLPMLLTLTAQRAAAASLLGEQPGWAELVGPERDLAAALLRSLRPVVYGFEVVAARTPSGERGQVSDTLRRLRQRARQLGELAAGSAPPDDLGYALPYPVNDAESRNRLATEMLTGLQQAVASRSAATAGDPEAVTGAVQLLTDAVVVGHGWGVPLAAFPGMDLG